MKNLAGEQNDNLITALTVAWLASEGCGKSQDEIADQLNLSQAAVSRFLRKAHESGYIEARSPWSFNESMAGAMMPQIRQRAQSRKLSPLLNTLAQNHGHPRGPELHVIGIPQNEALSPTHRFLSFTSRAAPLVRTLLVREAVETCGVTWGFMLWDLSKGMRTLGLSAPWRPKRPIRFIPLTGDPLQDRKLFPPSLTSSNIAAELSGIANGDDYQPPWLGLVPAYIPDQFRGAALAGIERLINMVPEYQDIFQAKGRSGIAWKLDAIVTSVGPAAHPMGFGLGRLFKSLGQRVNQLSTEIHGDIGGVLLPRNPRRPSALIGSIERRWKGLKREHLEVCARRAFEEDPAIGRPGIIVLAVGVDRAEVVLHAIASGLINRLIIDEELQQELGKLVSRSVATV